MIWSVTTKATCFKAFLIQFWATPIMIISISVWYYLELHSDLSIRSLGWIWWNQAILLGPILRVQVGLNPAQWVIRREIEIAHWKSLNSPHHNMTSMDFLLRSMVIGPCIGKLRYHCKDIICTIRSIVRGVNFCQQYHELDLIIFGDFGKILLWHVDGPKRSLITCGTI